MIYLSEKELVKNIAEQTERVSAIIEHTDFESDKINPNAVIIPMLGNILDSALIVTALENNSDENTDCHRHALRVVMMCTKISANTKKFIEQINRTREKYTLDSGSRKFDSAECLDFLNAYDCFMYDFINNSPTVENIRAEGGNVPVFSSIRNMVEKILKKNSANSSSVSQNDTLAQLLAETKRTNELLEKLINILAK